MAQLAVRVAAPAPEAPVRVDGERVRRARRDLPRPQVPLEPHARRRRRHHVVDARAQLVVRRLAPGPEAPVVADAERVVRARRDAGDAPAQRQPRRPRHVAAAAPEPELAARAAAADAQVVLVVPVAQEERVRAAGRDGAPRVEAVVPVWKSTSASGAPTHR